MPNEALYECLECGGPEWSETSMHGCRTNGCQGSIVPRGTLQKIRERPEDIRATEVDGMVVYSIDDVFLLRLPTTSQFDVWHK